DRGHRRAQPAVEEDEREGDGPDPVRERVVLERDPADRLIAGEHADGEEEDEDRESDPRRELARGDPEQEQDGADEEDAVYGEHALCRGARVRVDGRIYERRGSRDRARRTVGRRRRAAPAPRRRNWGGGRGSGGRAAGREGLKQASWRFGMDQRSRREESRILSTGDRKMTTTVLVTLVGFAVLISLRATERQCRIRRFAWTDEGNGD